MPYWRAPLAKNTAAMVAIELWQARGGSDLDNLFLVCLDADNVLVSKHVQRIVERLEQSVQYPWYKRLLINFKGDDCGVSGRDGYFASAFVNVRGYRQSLHSHGFQDSDLRDRLVKQCDLEHGNDPNISYSRAKLTKSGYSICNDPGGNEVKGYGESKLLHCPPDELNRFEKWSNMVGANQKIANKEDANQEGEDNYVVNEMVDRLGCEYRKFVIRDEGEAAALPCIDVPASSASIVVAAAKAAAPKSRNMPPPAGPPPLVKIRGSAAQASAPPLKIRGSAGSTAQAAAPDIDMVPSAHQTSAPPLKIRGSAGSAAQAAAPDIDMVPSAHFLAAATAAAQRARVYRGRPGAPELNVELYTLGYSLALEALGPFAERSDWDATASFRSNPALCWRKGKWFKVGAHFLDIDCTVFKDPEAVLKRSRLKANHIGLHPEILLTLLGIFGRQDVRKKNKDSVTFILGKYAQALKMAVDSESKELDVVLWCSKGRHRSVGIAALLQGVHARFFGPEIDVNVKNLNEAQWHHETCECCRCLRRIALYVCMYVFMYACCMYAHMMVWMCVCM
jgi:hypothetical protein